MCGLRMTLKVSQTSRYLNEVYFQEANSPGMIVISCTAIDIFMRFIDQASFDRVIVDVPQFIYCELPGKDLFWLIVLSPELVVVISKVFRACSRPNGCDYS